MDKNAIKDPKEFYEERICLGPLSPNDIKKLVALLWQEYGEEVFLRVYARLECIEDARDITQDTFIKVLEWLNKNSNKIPPKINFPAWIHRIAYNLIIDRFRRPLLMNPLPVKKHSENDEDPPSLSLPDERAADPANHLVKQEELDVLDKCLNELEEKSRKVIILRFIRGMSYQEVAQKLVMPVNTIGIILHRTLKRLRECVELRLSIFGME